MIPEHLTEDAARVLDAILVALDGQSGDPLAFPAALLAATELLFTALLWSCPADLQVKVQQEMVASLRLCTTRVARSQQADWMLARSIIRAVLQGDSDDRTAIASRRRDS